MEAMVCAAIAPLMIAPRADCERADEALYGMRVEILEEAGEWVRVRTHYRYEGWTQRASLGEADPAFDSAKKRVILKPFADLMAEPKVQSYPLISLTRGAVVGDGGQETEGGWVSVRLCDGRTAWTRGTYVGEYIETHDLGREEALRRALVDSAMAYLGTQYRWGGKTPLGIDCSGLCSMAYLLNGIIIHRDASIKPEFCMHKIAYRDIKMGDLIFFPGHVAMYIENGRFIHSTSHPGDEGVVLASLNPEDPDFRGDLLEKMRECGSVFG